MGHECCCRWVLGICMPIDKRDPVPSDFSGVRSGTMFTTAWIDLQTLLRMSTNRSQLLPASGALVPSLLSHPTTTPTSTYDLNPDPNTFKVVFVPGLGLGGKLP